MGLSGLNTKLLTLRPGRTGDPFRTHDFQLKLVDWSLNELVGSTTLELFSSPVTPSFLEGLTTWTFTWSYDRTVLKGPCFRGPES